jgi:hypothetical protein
MRAGLEGSAMPRAAASAQASVAETCRLVDELLAAAMTFVPRDRGEAMLRKWLGRFDPAAMSEERLVSMSADAVVLSADLLLSTQAASGMTALDRLARSRTGALGTEATAIAALRQARFRLLRLEDAVDGSGPRACDVISNQSFYIVGAELPRLPAGTVLFGRTVMLEEGCCCLPSAITPLDAAAFAVARGHTAAGAAGPAAGARWAEAVYGHVVQHGTLDVPGLNRPAGDREAADDLLDGGDDKFVLLAASWAALADQAPDADLLQRTRQCTNLPTVLDALAAALSARDACEEGMAQALERLLLVQLETVLHRERNGVGTINLDTIATAMNDAVATGSLPLSARAFFGTLRQRLVGSHRTRNGDHPSMERLVQRIQALRAKTVAQGCTEEEALAAAEKAAELLDRYGLSLGEVEFRAQPCAGIGIQTDRRRFAPIDSCVPGIAAFFDCRVWLERVEDRALRYVFFGLRGDVAAAEYLYDLVEQAFRTETEAFRASPLYARMASARRSATHSFQIGLGRGICDKLGQLQVARDAGRRSITGRDLVPVKAAMVDEEVAKLGLDLHARALGRGRRVLSDAFSAGQAAGQNFEYRPAITQAA